jgi:hypothetical protein
MAVAGMLSAVREKLFGMEFDNLGQLKSCRWWVTRPTVLRKTPGSANSTT